MHHPVLGADDIRLHGIACNDNAMGVGMEIEEIDKMIKKCDEAIEQTESNGMSLQDVEYIHQKRIEKDRLIKEKARLTELEGNYLNGITQGIV